MFYCFVNIKKVIFWIWIFDLNYNQPNKKNFNYTTQRVEVYNQDSAGNIFRYVYARARHLG